MKVGIVTENYFPTLGGIQEHVYYLKKHLPRYGVDVRVLTGVPAAHDADGPPDAEENVIRVGRSVRYGTMGTFTQATLGLDTLRAFPSILRRERFDLLHVHSPCDPGLPMLAFTAFHGPTVATLHSYFPHRPFRRLLAPYYRLVLSRAAAVVAVSDATRDAMRRYARFRSEVIPNGVDVTLWESGRPIAALKDGMKNILYVGRLEPRNGCDLLIDAFTSMARARADLRLVIVGGGPERSALVARVPRDLRERVRFLGPLHRERPDVYASCDLMAIPARAVGFSILLLEALAAGLPVVALPAPGVPAAGLHWAGAMLAPHHSAPSLAEAVEEALEVDHAERVGAGRRIARGFDWSNVARRVLAVYKQVLS